MNLLLPTLFLLTMITTVTETGKDGLNPFNEWERTKNRQRNKYVTLVIILLTFLIYQYQL